MPRKSAMVLLAILGIICLVDGIPKKDTREIIVAVVILLYAVISLINGRQKKPASANHEKTSSV